MGSINHHQWARTISEGGGRPNSICCRWTTANQSAAPTALGVWNVLWVVWVLCSEQHYRGRGPEDAPADGDDDSWVSSERVVFWVVKTGGRYESCAVWGGDLEEPILLDVWGELRAKSEIVDFWLSWDFGTKQQFFEILMKSLYKTIIQIWYYFISNIRFSAICFKYCWYIAE